MHWVKNLLFFSDPGFLQGHFLFWISAGERGRGGVKASGDAELTTDRLDLTWLQSIEAWSRLRSCCCAPLQSCQIQEGISHSCRSMNTLGQKSSVGQLLRHWISSGVNTFCFKFSWGEGGMQKTIFMQDYFWVVFLRQRDRENPQEKRISTTLFFHGPIFF